MRDLFRLADEVQSFCQDRGWRFCFIGGIALQRWGEPRLTGDIDLTILTGFGGEAGYVEELCRGFAERVADAAEFALRSRVLLLQSENGIPIMPADSAERRSRRLARASASRRAMPASATAGPC